MCFFSQLSAVAQTLENRFNAKFENTERYISGGYNGFQHPETPVIIHKEPEKIQLFSWGLIPHWAKDESIRKSTLNARIETIHEKLSFREVVNNRCLVLADKFFEWQWLDEKGKKKQKYEATLAGKIPFAFAGLWSEWRNQLTGETKHTYTLLTMSANELMSRIHNSKKRMPVILNPGSESGWLSGKVPEIANEWLVAVAI